ASSLSDGSRHYPPQLAHVSPRSYLRVAHSRCAGGGQARIKQHSQTVDRNESHMSGIRAPKSTRIADAVARAGRRPASPWARRSNKSRIALRNELAAHHQNVAVSMTMLMAAE